ncbi:M14 family zinc carboxypeptidase [Paucisalibacillus globulus]|uniref:M14 family zinc carboxypeptidase n=1 Tax=Paucisalibacillus globulus TaxID=351095 RepID=UPI000BB8141F|nr:M14 family zinc carboxypeptidase [Paucisalibacillus globulus]
MTYKKKLYFIPLFFVLIFLVPSIITAEEELVINNNYQSTNYGNYFKVINNEAIVYDNSRGKLIQIGSLVKGESYPIVSDYGNWHRINFGSKYGYVHKKNTVEGNKSSIQNQNKLYENLDVMVKVDTDKLAVFDNSSGKLLPFAYLVGGKKYKIVSDYGNWYRVLFANRIGYIKKSEVTLIPPEISDYFEVVSDDVPVYDNRTGKLIKMGILKKGEVYKRVSDYGNWHRIQFGDSFGYVKKSLTKYSYGNSIKNLNKNYKNSTEKFMVNVKTDVFDNSDGGLNAFATLEAGSVYPIVSDYGNWYRILVSDRIGFVKKQYLKGYFSKNSKYFEVMESGLIVYDNRNGSLKKIGELEKGQVYERVRDYGNWHQIQFGDHYGYVHKTGTLPSFKNQIPNLNSKYQTSELNFTSVVDTPVYDNSTGKLIPFATIQKGTSHAIATDYGNWYRILIANRVGYVRKSDVKVSFTKNIRYFKVTEDNLPIYDNRSGSLIKVGKLKKGQVYERVSDYGNWHQIQFGNYYGYVNKSSTEPFLSGKYNNKITRKSVVSILTPKADIIVYDNTGGVLVPFATIGKGKEYPVVRNFGNWYEVNIAGRYGYVKKSHVDVKTIAKNIVNPRQVYSYEEMESDIFALAKNYPGLISWKTIGKSVNGRNLYAIKLGTGKTEVYFNASTHAREWLTTNLLMEMIDVYSQAYVKNQNYEGYNVKQILDNTSIWFVPMVNPDGVTLVQEGPYRFSNPVELIRLNNGSTNFRSWKANIRGIDLNRQYPQEWSTITNNPGKPGPFNFKGYKPLTEPEAVALMNFSRAHNFKTEVAYHSSGELIYFGDDVFTPGSYMYNLSKKVANMVSAKTGYRLMYTRGIPGGGTYTDFVQHEMNRVALTPEISPYVGNKPIPVSSFDSIWKKNNTVGLMIAKEAYTR